MGRKKKKKKKKKKKRGGGGGGDRFEEAFGDAAWYVGKDYGKHGATRSLRWGSRSFMPIPLEFAKKDPEHVSFLLGILDGGTFDDRQGDLYDWWESDRGGAARG